jgi:cystathionine beta-lyase/cystathionine gamma-synthase
MEAKTYNAWAQEYISALEKAKHTLLFNSGISTLSAVLSMIPTNSTIVTQDDFYSGTRHLVGKIFGPRLQNKILKPTDSMEVLVKILKEYDVSLVLIESPSNPLLQIYDIEEISKLVRAHRKDSLYPILMVDNTLATPVFQNPLVLGADLVVHSATKFLAGHSDTLAGSISTNDDTLYKLLCDVRERMGNHLEEFSC